MSEPLMLYGLIAAGTAAGFLAGWIITRAVLRRRLASYASVNDRLAGDLERAGAEKDSLKATLEQYHQELQAADRRYLELSNAHAASENSLEQMQALKTDLAAKTAEVRTLLETVSELKQRQAELACRMESEREAAREKAVWFEEMRARMIETFTALSGRVLQENNQAFLDLAGQTFSGYVAAARTDFEGREKAVREMVKPVAQVLEKYDQQVRSMEKAREKAYGELTQQVLALSHTQNELQRETGKLVNALRMPHVRGRWGEITLRRVVEISGMQNRCDFFEQPTEKDGQNTVRPDMIIQLPGDRRIIVDSKVPITAYLDSLEAPSRDGTEEMLERHARHVQTHVQKLAQKEYWTQFAPTPEFVILFMPGENFFSAALGKMPGLIEEAAGKGVILATPTTLISLLKAVSYGWKQTAAADNARAVSTLGNELYNRLASLVDHLNSLGRDLEKCVSTFNQTVGSLERRVLPSARKFEEMGVTVKGGKTLIALSPVENKPRRMVVEEDA